MENALPVVPQDWRALWKIKTTNSSRSTQLTSSGSPLPPSSGKPATPEEAEATVEPVKMSKAARKRANRNARMAAIANTATCTAPSAVIANCPSLSPLQDMKIPSDKPEPPADPGDSASGSPRQNNKRPLSRGTGQQTDISGESPSRDPDERSESYRTGSGRPQTHPETSPSYAIFEFASAASATEAYEMVNKASTINGKTFIVDFCGTKSKLNPKQLLDCGELDMLTLFVSGLKFLPPFYEIRKSFPSAFDVCFGGSGRRTPNKKRHLPDNSCIFVMFASEEAAREAFSQETVIDGQRVQVQYAYKSAGSLKLKYEPTDFSLVWGGSSYARLNRNNVVFIFTGSS
ncbi:hypothetical protein RvY_06072-1 [Ramazzottius varieornatus]|uniref:RRM domain-containing protein n=1 Tax=Ramazzottius varieornatus TaxID=947166 RepID=A0A1D1V636_RAMVA|nr:hypothetical protein RvY_06072-1 [Ramazzottius varieornatus]